MLLRPLCLCFVRRLCFHSANPNAEAIDFGCRSDRTVAQEADRTSALTQRLADADAPEFRSVRRQGCQWLASPKRGVLRALTEQGSSPRLSKPGGPLFLLLLQIPLRETHAEHRTLGRVSLQLHQQGRSRRHLLTEQQRRLFPFRQNPLPQEDGKC
jgi:hypothetical protein